MQNTNQKQNRPVQAIILSACDSMCTS